ncbi:MAG TPA: flagellar hook protein FlgE [Bryobacteraceae bacterium]|nr:flagellar hook protein FlgE [Bryobacteraceae bacterium]
MFPAYSVSLSALQADSSAIDVVGNDLANLNTTGYKATDIDFENLMSQSLGIGQSMSQVGMGVGPLQTVTSYTQGTLTTTNGPTDAAIQGNGFFVVKGSDGQMLYTRDGSFQVNDQGQLVTATGEAVQGWSAVNGVVNPSGAVGNLTAQAGSTIPATATTTMSMDVNLNAATAADGTFSAPIQVIDSQGTSHTLTVTFTETSANNWKYAVTIPSADLQSGGTTTLASSTLTFNPDGSLSDPDVKGSPVALKISGLADGAADVDINWNLYNADGSSMLTQYAEASGVSSTSQNGYSAGQISSFSLQNGGTLIAKYSNGQQITLGQLALANVPNPDSLVSVGNNELQSTVATGSITLGAAQSAGLGKITAGALETSTVDIANEFANLLTYERSYQAASRVITTNDQMLQGILELIHP